MNIGIDIDDTLTDIRDELKLAAEKYANKLGKEIKDNKYVIKGLEILGFEKIKDRKNLKI